jgi:hypothetical protein
MTPARISAKGNTPRAPSCREESPQASPAYVIVTRLAGSVWIESIGPKSFVAGLNPTIPVFGQANAQSQRDR